VDEAIRARFSLIPFAVKIPEEERDEDLPAKLETEWPAILRWAIDGTLEWQRNGLKPPPVVLSATNDYLSEEDAHTLWFEEACERMDGSRENTCDLFASWKACEWWETDPRRRLDRGWRGRRD
jgi:putative DNA primase/helicase